MQRKSIFKSWVPDWTIKAVLVFCMLHSMVLLGLYTSNVTYAASYLDVEPEDLQYALCITYGTFLATIFVESFLFRFFPTRNYFVCIYALAALTFVLSAYTQNFVLFLFLRAAEGVLMALPWIPLRILLLTRFHSKGATVIVFSLTYGMLLMASPFIMNIAVWLLENYNWTYMAYGSAFFQLICVGLVLLTFSGHRFHKKTPLYQIDWASFVLLHLAILCGAYVLVYGEKKYWFQSAEIIWCSIGASLSGGLFLVRQLLIKRPLFDLTVFRFANLRTGFFLFILFYISRSTLNICHNVMGKIWNWEPSLVAHVQYLNVLGNAIGMLIAAVLMNRMVTTRYLFILGFSVMAIYHFWFTFLFVPDISLMDIAIPYVLQGVAVGILFVPLVLFTVSAVPSHLARFSGTVGVTGRFWGNAIGFCLLQNVQVFLQQKHYNQLQGFVLPDHPETQARFAQTIQTYVNKGFSADEAGRLALKQITEGINKQAVLLSSMEIFTAIGWGLVLLVVLIAVNRHMRRTFDIFRNRFWSY